MEDQLGPFLAGVVVTIFLAFIYSMITKKSISLPGTGTRGGSGSGSGVNKV